jgi:3D (Asp-Asp-Asp) domain-containing protein
MSKLLIGILAVPVLTLAWLAPTLGRGPAVAWAADDELAVGRTATVRDTEGDRLLLRASPGLSQPVQATVLEGARVQIVEGPQPADGHQWFRVSATAGSGWASARHLVLVDERAATAAARGPLPPGSTRTVQMRIVGYNLTGTRTATGTTPRWGTVAVDPQVIPLGTRLQIEGFEGTVFVAEDTGSAVRGSIVDIWFDDPAAARRFGTQTRTVTLLDQR